ncbi:MAG: hypothetical protein ACKVS8_07920 [Phycisphaerales bacterium]
MDPHTGTGDRRAHSRPHTDPPTRAATSACIIWHPGPDEPPPELIRSFQRHGASLTLCTDRFAALAHACLATRPHAANAPRAVLVILVNPLSLPGAADLVRALRRFAPASAAWAFERTAKPALRAVSAGDLIRWSAPPSVSPPSGRGQGRAEDPPAVRGQGRAQNPPDSTPEPATPSTNPGDPNPIPLRIDQRRSRSTPPRQAQPRLRLAGQEGTVHGPLAAGSSHTPAIEPKPLASAQAPSPAPDSAAPDPGPLLSAEELSMLLSDDFAIDPSLPDDTQDEPPPASSAAPRAS